MDNSPQMDLAKVLRNISQRKGLIIAVTVVVFGLAGYLAASLPNVYRSSTLVLILPQRLPSTYIHSTVTSSIQERIHSITQQILSRTSLEKIVKEFNLYLVSAAGTTTEDRVGQLRKNINIDIRHDKNDRSGLLSSAFLLSFDAGSPDKAMQVTTRLASLFIEENLKVREQQAMGTTSFINAEVERIRKELEEQESEVNQYKAKYLFELPDQLDANLRMLEQLRGELQTNTIRRSSLEERKAGLETQKVEAEAALQEAAKTKELERMQISPRWQKIESRKTELAALLTQYSERHPDISRLKEEIQAMEKEAEAQESKYKELAPAAGGSSGSPVRQMLLKQIGDLDQELASLQSRDDLLRRSIASYEARVGNTPLRAIELSKISRTYDITLKKYQDLLGKSLESQLSENMEKKQKGEQFQIQDPANFPQRPIWPNRPKILLLGLFGGLVGGFGLAFFWQNLDRSVKGSEELDGWIDVPLLATLPAVITRASVLEQRRSHGILVLASVSVLGIGLVLIHLIVPVFF